jgi:hypothetical protein
MAETSSYNDAVKWLVEQPGTEPVTLQNLFWPVHERFGLTAWEAKDAIEQANVIRARSA